MLEFNGFYYLTQTSASLSCSAGVTFIYGSLTDSSSIPSLAKHSVNQFRKLG